MVILELLLSPPLQEVLIMTKRRGTSKKTTKNQKPWTRAQINKFLKWIVLVLFIFSTFPLWASVAENIWEKVSPILEVSKQEIALAKTESPTTMEGVLSVVETPPTPTATPEETGSWVNWVDMGNPYVAHTSVVVLFALFLACVYWPRRRRGDR